MARNDTTQTNEQRAASAHGGGIRILRNCLIAAAWIFIGLLLLLGR